MSDTWGEHTPMRDVVATALGRRERLDPVLAGTGGPAGNALLTAWLGLVLLVLFFLEGLTLLDVRGLITWHVALGALLVPPAVAKTVTIGWRIVRYYSGQREYRTAGPPPLVLRLLGPLVVLTTLVLLGSGVILVLLGEESSRQSFLNVLGLRLDCLGLHKAVFWAWFVTMAAHVLARTLPALRLVIRRHGVPGISYRVAALTLSLVVAAGAAVWLVGAEGNWGHGRFGERDDDHSGTAQER
jgi:hypothetical protein